MAYKIYDNVNGFRDATAEETTQIDADRAANPTSAEKKLAKIKQIRQWELEKTDYLANSDVTMPDNIKTWRQSLRDIPANHTDENAYNLLLARDSNGKLTHSIWTQPTE
tara:strand:+ start:698 stop:1024 length:327 start_codon:yes stop_codon:yes gene_type:complete